MGEHSWNKEWFEEWIKVNIPANSTWSGLLSYFQGIKIKRFSKW
jgi:hypothetical protein